MTRWRSRTSPAAGLAVRLGLCTALAVFLIAAPVGHSDAAANGIAVSGQWFRFVMRSLPAAGYFTLSNATATAQTLIGAQSTACEALMLHRSVNTNGEERMVMVPNVPVPAHGSVRFAPGGYHLMCMSPKPAMTPGQSVPVTLRLANGETVNAQFPVRGASGK
jgi:periplasmic copper chaperone A